MSRNASKCLYSVLFFCCLPARPLLVSVSVMLFSGHHGAQLSAPSLGHVPPPPPLGHVPPPAPQLPPPAGHHPHPSPPRPVRVQTEVSPVATMGVAPVLPQADESPTKPVSSHGTNASKDSHSAKPKEGSEVMTVNQPTAQPHTKASTTIPTSPATGGGEPVSASKGTEEQKKPVKISFSGRKRLSSGGPPAGAPATTSSAKLHVASQQVHVHVWSSHSNLRDGGGI